MPDLDELLRERLGQPLGAAPPPLAELRRRSARRRAGRASAVGLTAAACVAVALAVPGLTLPDGQRDTAGYAAPGAGAVRLDSDTGPDGPWRLEVTRDDGVCLQYTAASMRLSGGCRLSTPGRLAELSTFPTWAGDQWVVVVAGPAPPGTESIEVDADQAQAVVNVRPAHGLLFWSTRVPAGDRALTVVARDAAGAEIARVELPPPPQLEQQPSGGPQLELGCPMAVQAENGEAGCADG